MISEIIHGVKQCFSRDDEIIFLFDNCTDNSLKLFQQLNDFGARVIVPDAELFEIKANNVLLREAKGNVVILFQDDMVCEDIHIKEKIGNVIAFYGKSLGLLGGRDGFELNELSFPEKPISRVSAWQHIKDENTLLKPFEYAGRTILNRGPLVFTKDLLRNVGYLDEIFYPQWGDDVDYCCRARFSHGLQNVVFQCDIKSPLEWGTTRRGSKLKRGYDRIMRRNWDLITSRWGKFLTTKV